MRKAFVITLLTVLLAAVPAAAVTPKPFVVVLDPGHGGHDHGTCTKTASEKDICLNVAKLVGKKLHDCDKSFDIKYTRDTDKFITLDDRPKIANSHKGDLFVSIHVNSADKKNKNRASIHGAEVYTVGLHRNMDNLEVARRENSVITLEDDYTEVYKGFDPNSPESYIAFELGQSKHIDRSIGFAVDVLGELQTTAGRANRGVRQAGFWVLWNTSMPSVLIELDFLCNPNVEKFLTSASGQDKLATAIYNAIIKYYDRIHPEQKGSDKKTASNPTSAAETAPAESTAESTTETFTEESAPSGIEYRVQIMASDKAVKTDSPQFKGEKDVDCYVEKGWHKYTVGHYSTGAEAKKRLKKIKSKFPQAFVIEMKDGVRQ